MMFNVLQVSLKTVSKDKVLQLIEKVKKYHKGVNCIGFYCTNLLMENYC